MTTYISIFLFICFGFWAFFLACKTNTENPKYIIFLLSMGLFRPSGSLPGGFDLSSMWLLLNIILLMFVFFRNITSYSGLTMVERIYLLYLFYAIIITIPKIGITTSLEFSLRVLLKQLYPFFVLIITANLFRKNEYLDIAISRTLIVTLIVAICFGGFAEKFWPFTLYIGNFIWIFASLSDHSAIITSLALVWWATTHKKRYLLVAIILGIATILTGNRTGIAATIIGLSFFMLSYIGIIRSIPLLLVLYLAGMSILFLYPVAQEHMFVDPTVVDPTYIIRNPMDIDFNTINSSGRFEAWEYLLDNFWRPHPLIGSGLGAVQNYLYSLQNISGMIHPHSSYVKVLSDSGLIGLCLFVAIHLACMFGAYRTLKSQSSEQAKIAARFVLCAVPSLFFIMGFDSAINCATAVMQYSFIFTGIMIGLSSKRNDEASI